MLLKWAMDLSGVKYVVNNLMSTRYLARVSYLISGYNIVTRYIMVPNPNGNPQVRLILVMQKNLNCELMVPELQLQPVGLIVYIRYCL